MSAYVAPLLDEYLTELESRLAEIGLRVPVRVMQSSGGIITAEEARRNPVQTLLSGPGRRHPRRRRAVADPRRAVRACAVSCASTWAAPASTSASWSTATSRSRCRPRSTATTCSTPAAAIHTIGAGGGSVAHVEAGGLRVGPRSAGAVPGPACYGRGGTRADRHRLQPAARPPARLGPPRRRARPRSRRRRGRRRGDGRSARPVDRAVRRRRRRRRRRGDGQRHPRAHRRPRHRPARRSPSSPSAAPGRCTPPPSPTSWTCRRSSSPPIPACCRRGACCRRDYRLDTSANVFSRLEHVDLDRLRATESSLGDELRAPSQGGRGRDGGRDDAGRRRRPLRRPGVHGDDPASTSRSTSTAIRRRSGRGSTTPTSPASATPTLTRTWRSSTCALTAVARDAASGRGRRSSAEGTRRAGDASNTPGSPTESLDTPVWDRVELPAGTRLDGPAIVLEPACTTLVPPGWRADVTPAGHLLMRRGGGDGR